MFEAVTSISCSAAGVSAGVAAGVAACVAAVPWSQVGRERGEGVAVRLPLWTQTETCYSTLPHISFMMYIKMIRDK